jgi:hypothetical protein
MENPNQLTKVEKEFWPESFEEEFGFNKESDLVPRNKESNLQMAKTVQEKEQMDGSYIADSDEGD